MKCAVVLLAMCLVACSTKPQLLALPPPADIAAAIEPKPLPPATILTDPAASDRYNSAIEGWGERVSAAGARLCRFFAAQGMKVNCPKPRQGFNSADGGAMEKMRD